MNKSCLNCKKEFEAKRESAKYCSDNCRVKWNYKNKGNKKKLNFQVAENKLLDLIEKLESKIVYSPTTPASYDAPVLKVNYDEAAQYQQPQLTKKDVYKAKMNLAKDFGELSSIVKQVETDKDLAKWERTTLINEANFIRQDKGFYND